MTTQKLPRPACPRCGYDANATGSARCEVCNQSLARPRTGRLPMPALALLGIVGLGTLGGLGWLGLNRLGLLGQQSAAPVSLTVSADSWAGYFWLRQGADPESVFGKILAKQGITLTYEDEPDQEKRARKVADGTYPIAMTTTDQVLLNDFAAKVVAMVDVSEGGDAVLLGRGLGSIDDIKPGMRVAYARATPSETLLRTLALRFKAVDLKRLTPVEVTVADEAWDLLKAGKVDIAVLWQPFTGFARRAGYTVALTSADARNVILDVLIASGKADPATVKKFVAAYCQALDYYTVRPQQLRRAIGVDSKVTGQDLDDLSRGIHFVPCPEADAVWFGGGLFQKRSAVIGAIVGAQNKQNLVDPTPVLAYTHIDDERRRAVAALDPSLVAPIKTTRPPRRFASLTTREAVVRPVIGSLRIGKIQFATNSATLTVQGIQTLEQFRSTLDDFPDLRVLVEGHTSRTGNPTTNRQLSQQRASAVVDFFVSKGYLRNRFSALGYGASRPLAKLPTWSASNQRTEIKLIR